MAIDRPDAATLAVVVGFGAFAVWYWLKWRQRVAWFDRVRTEVGWRDGDGDREDDQ